MVNQLKAETFPPNRRADRTRKAILRAAIREFSAHGLAGARTDAIAESAKVNKALIYYYFKSKRGLYAAALEEVSAAAVERAMAVFEPGRSAGARVLRTRRTRAVHRVPRHRAPRRRRTDPPATV